MRISDWSSDVCSSDLSPFGSAKPLAVLGRPGGYGEGSNTRSHPELGRENPQRRWYCVLRRGRVGRRQVFQARKKNSARENSQERHKTTPEIPIPSLRPDARRKASRHSQTRSPSPGVEQPGSSSGSSPAGRRFKDRKSVG